MMGHILQMEDYLKKYDSFTKIIVFDFKKGHGGIGDCIKFFMHTLNLCMKYNIKLFYLVNNNLLEKYLKLKYEKMYINKTNILESFMCNTHEVEHLQDGIYNIMEPALFYSVYNDNNMVIPINEVFTFSDEVKINGCRLNVNNVSNYISLHLRLGDKYLETDHSFVLVKHDARIFNEDNIVHFIHANSDKNILFFCDNHAYKLHMKTKCKNVIILNCDIGHTSLSNTTDAQILDAITEFYLMTNSEQICSASYSGFSVMAAKFNNIPIISI